MAFNFQQIQFQQIPQSQPIQPIRTAKEIREPTIIFEAFNLLKIWFDKLTKSDFDDDYNKIIDYDYLIETIIFNDSIFKFNTVIINYDDIKNMIIFICYYIKNNVKMSLATWFNLLSSTKSIIDELNNINNKNYFCLDCAKGLLNYYKLIIDLIYDDINENGLIDKSNITEFIKKGLKTIIKNKYQILLMFNNVINEIKLINNNDDIDPFYAENIISLKYNHLINNVNFAFVDSKNVLNCLNDIEKLINKLKLLNNNYDFDENYDLFTFYNYNNKYEIDINKLINHYEIKHELIKNKYIN
jgi:hypothetical protein